jgi:protein gp37
MEETPFPLYHVWLGISCEDQATADERIPLLLQTPAAVRWVSAEPLLGPIDLRYSAFNGADSLGSMEGIHWVVVGGESGPKARPMHPDWARSLLHQCTVARVPFFFKQWGEWRYEGGEDHHRYLHRVGKRAAGRLLDGRSWDEYPEVAK